MKTASSSSIFSYCTYQQQVWPCSVRRLSWALDQPSLWRSKQYKGDEGRGHLWNLLSVASAYINRTYTLNAQRNLYIYNYNSVYTVRLIISAENLCLHQSFLQTCNLTLNWLHAYNQFGDMISWCLCYIAEYIQMQYRLHFVSVCMHAYICMASHCALQMCIMIVMIEITCGIWVGCMSWCGLSVLLHIAMLMLGRLYINDAAPVHADNTAVF